MNEYQELKNKGIRYLIKGVLFLALCLICSQVVIFFEIPFAGLISESAIIAGWVALWRPMEIFLYELPELKREKKSL